MTLLLMLHANMLILISFKTQIKNIWHMAKVNIKSEKITPFGGIYYASKTFYALSLDKVINGTLGVRSSTYNGYQWDEIINVQPHTRYMRMETRWDRLAGNRSGLGHVNTVHGQSPMGKGVLCPNLNVFGFLSCRYAYAHDKNLKNIRKNNGICFFLSLDKIGGTSVIQNEINRF